MTRAAAVAGVAAVALACNDTGAYLYRARAFDDARGCLGDVAAVDVIAGADPGLGCAPRCLVQASLTDGGVATAYGATTCGPAPTSLDTSERDPRCAADYVAFAFAVAALLRYKRLRECVVRSQGRCRLPHEPRWRRLTQRTT